MKKLFENVGGNNFKLLTESVVNGQENVISGLKKVFSNCTESVSYRQVESVGLGYIKNVTEAQRVALQEARELAKSFGFEDDENSERFIKSDVEDVTFNKSEIDENDTSKDDVVGKFLSMMATMPSEQLPNVRTWKICIGMAEEAMIHYKNQRIGLNESK